MAILALMECPFRNKTPIQPLLRSKIKRDKRIQNTEIAHSSTKKATFSTAASSGWKLSQQFSIPP